MAHDGEGASILTHHQRTVLDAIAGENYFTERFYLAGGTALAEFHLKHRLSEDLDLFSEKQEVNAVPVMQFFQGQQEKLGIERIDTQRVFGLHTFFLRFKDKEVLKVDFNYYPFPLIEKGTLYKSLKVEGAYDIGVDKVHTVAVHPRARDYIDLYFIIREKGYNFPDLLMQAKAKFDWDISLVDLGARLLEASEMSDYPRMLKSIDHNKWKSFFIEEGRKLKSEIFN